MSTHKDMVFEVQIPSNAFRTPGLTWSTLENKSGHLIYVADLNIETTGCFEIIRSVESVQFLNRRRAAFIFRSADKQTHEIIVDIILDELKVMPSVQGILKDVAIHPSSDDVLVVTFPWEYRNQISDAKLEKAIHLQCYNKNYQSLVRRALLFKTRSEYDVAVLHDFNKNCSRFILRKFQSNTFTSRFSDFVCKATFNYATSIAFKLEFDLKCIENYANAIIRKHQNNHVTVNKSKSFSLVEFIKEIAFNSSIDSSAFNGFAVYLNSNTHGANDSITLTCKNNNKANIEAISTLISKICGIPLNKSN